MISDRVRILRRPAEWSHWLPWVFLLLIILAELLIAYANPYLGLSVDALLVAGLTVGGALAQRVQERQLSLALVLVPLLRILSLSLPLELIPRQVGYAVVAIVVLIATWIIVRRLHISGRALGLTTHDLPLQLLIMCGGLGLGAVEYIILKPDPFFVTFSWPAYVLAAPILIVATGFVEELIFRGLLQSVAMPILGRRALVYVSLLFAAVHVGDLSFLQVAFVFGVGLLFAIIVRWTGSILGVALAHGVTNVMVFLIMPYLAKQAVGVDDLTIQVILGGTALAVAALAVLMLRVVRNRRA